MSLARILQCPIKTRMYRSMNIELCDVSLRDGLQTESASEWNTCRKYEYVNSVLSSSKHRENPAKIEVGSLVSPRVFPIMEDTLKVHSYASKLIKVKDVDVEPFVLVPSFSRLNKALVNGIEHISFISSVSDAFQQKNTGKTVDQTLIDLGMCAKFLEIYGPHVRTKLYISCISECPINGQLSMRDIVYNCMRNAAIGFDEVCLSDTCGTLTHTELAEITENLSLLGFPMNKISLHLHADHTNAREVDNILRYSFMRGIRMFDVSSLSSGGCSRTMAVGKTKPNLSYELFYGSLEKYLMSMN